MGSWLSFEQGARRFGLTHHTPSRAELYLEGIVVGFSLVYLECQSMHFRGVNAVCLLQQVRLLYIPFVVRTNKM